MTLIRIAAAGLLVIMATACESTRAQVSVSPSDAIAVLDCQAVIGSEATPAEGDSVVLDRVALPTKRALQANRTGDPGARPFAKDGLYIRRDVSVDLIVPNEWRDRLTINWGFQEKRRTTCGCLAAGRREPSTRSMTKMPGWSTRVATPFPNLPASRSSSRRARRNRPCELAWARPAQARGNPLRRCKGHPPLPASGGGKMPKLILTGHGCRR